MPLRTSNTAELHLKYFNDLENNNNTIRKKTKKKKKREENKKPCSLEAEQTTFSVEQKTNRQVMCSMNRQGLHTVYDTGATLLLFCLFALHLSFQIVSVSECVHTSKRKTERVQSL